MTEVEWWNLRAPQLRSLQDEDALVIVPVGSTEQHGPHLPVMVDALLAGEIARRTARRLAGERAVVVAPTVWSGLAEHHMSLGGTITLDYQTFFALLRCIASSMARHGFRRILLLNGHGGNINALNVIVGELTGELQIPIVGCTYWIVAAEAFGSILEHQRNVAHGGEAETSMVLALRPELVDTARLEEAKGDMPPEALHDAGAYRWRSMAAMTKTGVIGDASSASAEKGEKLLSAASEAIAKLVMDPNWWEAPS